MRCFKRYLVSCLIAVVFFAGFDAYHTQPDGKPHFGTILVVSAGWPIFAALVVGGTIGGVMHDMKSDKAG